MPVALQAGTVLTMYELVFLTGGRAGAVVPVTGNLIGGRSPDCSLEVPDPNASRQHARFTWNGSELLVIDNGSSNGTYVNDQKITTHRLAHSDVVRLGETRLRVQLRSLQDGQSSSIFGFTSGEDDAHDLSQSIVMSVSDLKNSARSPEVLAARLNAIIKVSHALVNITKLDLVFEGILETLFEVFPQADRGFLMLGKDAAKLEARAMRQRGKGATENLALSNTICKKVLESRSALLFNDQDAKELANQNMSFVSLHIRSAMSVPLMVGEEVLGLLQIDTPDSQRNFTKDDLELAVAVSMQAAIALHNALLLSRVEQETTMRNNLRRFLPGPLADQVVSGNMDLAMGGKIYKSTILISDVIGFTRMAEGLPPEQVVALMNRYFDRMVPAIEAQGGAIDKFMGDAIMAFWGIPFDKGSAAANAVQTALAMQTELAGFNSRQAAAGAPLLEMGIGLNTGTVVAGNIGSSKRSEYTVLGDAVNTTQRIESAAGGGQVLVSAATLADLAGAGVAIALPPLRVKNKVDPLAVYSLRGLRIANDEIVLHLPLDSNGQRAYIIRRLADRSFIIVHPATCDVGAAPLLTALPEWPGIDLGKPEMLAVLPVQEADGALLRSHVRLADDALRNLIGNAPLVCTRDWDAMPRSH